MTRGWSTTGGVSIEKQQPISVAETGPVVGSRLKPKSRRPLSIRALLLHSRGLQQQQLGLT